MNTDLSIVNVKKFYINYQYHIFLADESFNLLNKNIKKEKKMKITLFSIKAL